MTDDLPDANDQTAKESRFSRIPLYRWWRRAIVGTVDHHQVMTKVTGESGLSPRYLFMAMMSAGIAVLGLLLSSPAVVIGAMLISPLMGPILGLGFGLALFDFAELRRAVGAFLAGSVAAVLFTALIVLASPLKATTAEILARTRPNLFDLLVALFAALAGSFAIIRGRGETIVGVAIATALMPPLAVVGYGLATWNMPVLGGSLALFATNFVTIALAATIMARLYGFGHYLSSQQSWLQTALLTGAFVAMAIPLGFSLSQIAREALVVSQVRAFLAERFGPDARVTQLDVDFRHAPWAVRSVVIAPRDRAASPAALRTGLEQRLGRDVTLKVDQILLDPRGGEQAAQVALERANATVANGDDHAREIAALVAVAAGVDAESVTIDREHQRIVAAASPLPHADLATYRSIEARAAAAAEDWSVEIMPPLGAFPQIVFAEGSDVLDEAARNAVLTSAWAAKRWHLTALGVPGLQQGPSLAKPSLATRRAAAIAALLRAQGITPVGSTAASGPYRLTRPDQEHGQ